MWTYSKYLLTGIRAKSTFKTVFDFKKMIYLFFCYDYKHLPFSNKPYQPEMNFTEKKYLPGLLMPCPAFLHVTV